MNTQPETPQEIPAPELDDRQLEEVVGGATLAADPPDLVPTHPFRLRNSYPN